MKNAVPTWVIVAHRAGAQIYAAYPGPKFELLQTTDHPEGRKRDQEMDSDSPGRTFSRMTSARHALAPHSDSHENSAISFAHLLAEQLKKGRIDSSFKRLYLVAEPRFLGYLRMAMDPDTTRLVAGELQKDLVPLPHQEMVNHLAELVQHRG